MGRAFNSFATGNVSVSYEKSVKAKLPKLHVATLSPDVFAGSEGFEDVSTVQLFHAYRVYGLDKFELIRSLHGEAELPSDMPLTRADLWRWAQDHAIQAAVQARARHSLFRFVRT